MKLLSLSFFKTIFFSSIFACSALAIAVENTDSNSQSHNQNENALRAKVKARAYPGGQDEESLKVQSQLASPNRKMQPAQEPMESDDHSVSDSND